MSCVSWINCGDAGTWFAGFATLIAVLVALKASRSSVETATDLQRREHLRQDVRDQSLRHQLAITFDAEMYLLIAQLDFLMSKLKEASDDPGKLQRVMQLEVPKQGLVMTERLADKSVVFPDHLSGQVLALVGRWIMFRNGPPVPEDRMAILSGAGQLYRATQRLRDDLSFARALLAEHILPGTRVAPEIDPVEPFN